VVFGITGVVSLQFSRLVLNDVLELEGGLLTGPWSYQAAYLVIVPPFYSITLIAVGSLLGKHTYFKQRVTRMWSRLLVWRSRA